MKRVICYALIYIPAMLILIGIMWVIAYKWMPVRWTPRILKRTIENTECPDYDNTQIWTSIEDISPLLIRAVLFTEDQRFYSHNGFDVTELRQMRNEHLLYGKASKHTTLS